MARQTMDVRAYPRARVVGQACVMMLGEIRTMRVKSGT